MGVERLKGLGWRQGTVLPADLAAAVLGDRYQAGLRLIVISHDCDVTNDSLEKEPFVEVLIARRVEAADATGGNYRWGKNQRIYQLDLSEGGAKAPYRIHVHDRLSLDRGRLVNHSPDSAVLLEPIDVQRLAYWMAKRYRRAALPDSYNRRRVPVNSKMRRILSKRGDEISSLLLAVENAEKPPGEVYEIALYVVMLADTYSDTAMREDAERVLNDLAAALDDCEGIEVTEGSVVSEAHISLDDRRYLHELDEFDDQSLRQDPLGDLPTPS